jgi:hypothetical protein
VTIHIQRSASPELIASLKAKGQPIPDSTQTTHVHSCMDLPTWEKHNKYCVIKHSAFTADGFSLSAGCQGEGLLVSLNADETWAGGRKLHSLERMTTTYPDKGGVLTYEREVNSRFLDADCGSVIPGTPVEAP